MPTPWGSSGAGGQRRDLGRPQPGPRGSPGPHGADSPGGTAPPGVLLLSGRPRSPSGRGGRWPEARRGPRARAGAAHRNPGRGILDPGVAPRLLLHERALDDVVALLVAVAFLEVAAL